MGKSYLGQNFLTDTKYLKFIKDSIINYQKESNFKVVLEIGPGKGAITQYLKNIFNKIYLFEKDETFKKRLDSIVGKKGEVIWGDVLQQNVSEILKNKGFESKDVFVVGNLPYYITSPIFRKFFVDLNCFSKGIFMIQKEVGEKIQTNAKKKSFLRWLLNYNYNVKYLETVPDTAFTPAPKVDSCLVEIEKKDDIPDFDIEKLLLLLEHISQYKRKTLGKIWKIILKKQKIETEDKNKIVLNHKIFILSQKLEKKRLEKLNWTDMAEIINS